MCFRNIFPEPFLRRFCIRRAEIHAVHVRSQEIHQSLLQLLPTPALVGVKYATARQGLVVHLQNDTVVMEFLQMRSLPQCGITLEMRQHRDTACL